MKITTQEAAAILYAFEKTEGEGQMTDECVDLEDRINDEMPGAKDALDELYVRLRKS